MGHRSAFRQTDLERAVRGVQKAGVSVARVEIEATGKKIVIVSKTEAVETKPLDEWRADRGSRKR